MTLTILIQQCGPLRELSSGTAVDFFFFSVTYIVFRHVQIPDIHNEGIPDELKQILFAL